MTVCIFAGPTLGVEEGRRALDAIYLPPARQGDVYRAVRRHRPRVIGLVDGYFQDVPSVWHKEILWAMAEGVHVFGSASMGALRAAELATYGMRGVGRIFEAYRDGWLRLDEAEPFEDDDEVAVVHGPAASGFAPLSDALVNVRVTLAAAVAAGVLSPETRRGLLRIGKALFYPDRSYAALLERAGAAGLPAAELEALRAWLPRGRVDQKRLDALAMLTAIRGFLAGDPRPARVAYALQRSDMWRRATEGFEEADSPDEGPAAFEELVLDELRLDGSAWGEARRMALLRMMALRGGGDGDVAPDDRGRVHAAAALRQRLGLPDRRALEHWLAANGLDAEGWRRLVDDEARLEALARRWERSLRPHVLAHLRASGAYARYAARARAKERLVDHADAGAPLDGWTRLALTAWYVETRGGLVPEDVAAHAASLGFPDLEAFYRALRRERGFVMAAPRRGAPSPPAAPGAGPG
jgi:hypothetical protein